jgi:hypothetical protein
MFTPIVLDKTRNFRYGMVAINRIEKALGHSVNKLDLEDLSMEQAATIMWAGLVHEDKELTPERVMELVDDHSSLVTALEKMSEAFNQGFSGNQPPVKN